MIPNSLKIALIVGMAGGIATTLVLADVRANQEIEYVDGPSLTVLTSDVDYQKGDVVNIRIINSGSVPIQFTDASYGLKITGLAGMLIFSPWVTGEETSPILQPKEEHTLTWKQINNDKICVS